MTRRLFACRWCPTEEHYETDAEWPAPRGWVFIDQAYICPNHPRIQISHAGAKGKIVRYSPLPVAR